MENHLLQSRLQLPENRYVIIYLFCKVFWKMIHHELSICSQRKHLAQDQLGDLHELIEASEETILSYTYDGDTAPGLRSKVRKSGHIVLTNPDMLHSGILPHHTKWVSLI